MQANYQVDQRTLFNVIASVTNPDQLDPVNAPDAGSIDLEVMRAFPLIESADAARSPVTLFAAGKLQLDYNPHMPDGRYELRGVATLGARQLEDGTIELDQQLQTIRGDDPASVAVAYATLIAALTVPFGEESRAYLEFAQQFVIAGGLSNEQRENIALLQDPAFQLLPGSEDDANQALQHYAAAPISQALFAAGIVGPDGKLSAQFAPDDPNTLFSIQAELNRLFGGDVQFGVNAHFIPDPEGGATIRIDGNVGLRLNDGNLGLSLSGGYDDATGATNIGGGIQIRLR